MHTTLLKLKTALFFSFLVIYIYFIILLKLFISVAQASSSF